MCPMMAKNIDELIERLDEQTCKKALKRLLIRYLTPSFGSLLKRDIDLLILDVLEEIGYIDRNPTIYSLVQRLRITNTRARNLLYNHELRRLSEKELDEKIKEALVRPVVQKQGELFVLEIENPLVIDHLRSKLRTLGHATDGSFSPYLVKISIEALSSLIDSYLSHDERDCIIEKLKKLNVLKDDSISLRALIKAVVLDMCEKYVGGNTSKYIDEILKKLLYGSLDDKVEVLKNKGAKNNDPTAVLE